MKEWITRGLHLLLIGVVGFGIFTVFVILYGRTGHPAPIRAKVVRMRADMRALAAALEGYRIDHGDYPPNLSQLIFPIAHLGEMPIDIFNPNRHEGMHYLRLEDGYRIWSLGPDEQDDQAEILYHPTNGARSSGDLVQFDANTLEQMRFNQ